MEVVRKKGWINILKGVKRKLIFAVIVIAGLLLIGFISENLRRDAADKIDPPGDFIDYEGTDIHYIRKGSGERTVVFSAGSGTSSPYADIYHLQDAISGDTETMIYERPGYGWSDATERSRSIDTLTRELETVLEEGTENDSFLFVAHSMAALEAFSYTHRHPENVEGIVLIDGVHPQYASEMDRSTPVSVHLTKFAKNTGVLRLLSHIGSFRDNLVQEDVPTDVQDSGLALTLDRMWNETMLAEREMIPENGSRVNEAGSIGDIPLIIFSASDNPMEGWKASQENLPAMSNDSEQIWIDTENHSIHHEKPGKIVEKNRTIFG